MGSFIPIDSISIDLTHFNDKTDAGQCEHFSIRGYVSDIRQKDWKICWPFPVEESEEPPSLPPLDMPKFRWCRCENCQQIVAAEDINKNIDQPDSKCSIAVVNSGIQQAPIIPNSILAGRDIDLNVPIELSSDSDCVPITNERENNNEVVSSRIADQEIGLENNLNHQVPSVPSLEVHPGLIQEVDTNKRDCEGNEVSKVELVTTNLKDMDKSSSEASNEGKPISADNVTKDATEHLPPEPDACNHPVSEANTDNSVVKNDLKDHHSKKSTRLHRKKPRKMRLLSEILADIDRKGGSTSRCPSNVPAASRTLPTIPDKVVVEGDKALTNKGRGRKRKLVLDDDDEVENIEDNGSKDILVGNGSKDAIKGDRHKPNTGRSHMMSKKKKKKDKKIEDSFARIGAKNMSNMSESIPIPSAQAATNGEGLDEGLHRPLSSGKRRDNLEKPDFNKGKDKEIAQTAEEESEETIDDLTLEVAEILAWNQYKRSLPDEENASGLPENSTQKEKSQRTDEEIEIIPREKNVMPCNAISINYLTSYGGNQIGMNNLCTTKAPFSFGVSQSTSKPSSGIHFSPMDTSQVGPAQTSMFNRGIAVSGSSDATLQVQGGSNLRKTILKQHNEASNIWKPHATNSAFRRYDDVPKRAVSLTTSNNMDMTLSLGSSSQQNKQNKERDFDLNIPNFIGPETLGRTSVEYPFSCEVNGIEPHQNQRGFLDLNSSLTIPAMDLFSLGYAAGKQAATSFNAGFNAQMFKRPSYPGDSSARLDIGTSKERPMSDYYRKSYLSDKSLGYFPGSLPFFGASSSSQHGERFIGPTNNLSDQILTVSEMGEKMNSSLVGKQLRLPHLEIETDQRQQKLDVRGTHETLNRLNSISEITCVVNRNPADFTVPEAGNSYMINGEDLEFENDVRRRPGLPTPRGRKQKRSSK